MNLELQELHKEIIADLGRNSEVRWLVDANVVIGGEAAKYLGSHSDVWATSQVNSEIRKRPKSVDANKFADRIEANDQIVDFRDSLQGPELKGYDFLESCAKEFAPPIRIIKKEMIESGMPDSAETEINAIEQAANEGSFFECELVQKMVDAGLITPEQGEIDKATRRSWYKYPRKRREKQAEQDEYLFSDEILIASAIRDSIWNEGGSCILSNDNDLAAIMKQTSDNWLWAASCMDVEISYGKVDLKSVLKLWESRCHDLNQFRQKQNSKRLKQLFEALEGGRRDNFGEYWIPRENEVLICRPSNGGISSFCFSEPLVRFAKEYDWLIRQPGLSQLGIELPTQ